MLETLVGAVLILGTGACFLWYHHRLSSRTNAGEGPQLFHEALSKNLTGLRPDERVIIAWSGQVWTPPKSAAGELVGNAIDAIAKEAIGVSRDAPLTRVLVLSSGRVVVASEHRDGGERGYYRIARSFDAGVVARPVVGEELGPSPKNPYDPRVPMKLYSLENGIDAPFRGWLHDVCMSLRGDTGSPAEVLPVGADEAAEAWRTAEANAKARAVAPRS